MLGVSAEVLDRLDRLIEKHRLHASGAEPVDLSPLLDAFKIRYLDLPPDVEAALVRWRAHGKTFTRLLYQPDLREPAQSARKRYAGAHELAHAICDHRGDLYVMWRAGEPPGDFDSHLDRCRERECDRVAAYLLVPMPALRELANMDVEYIAAVLDVPAHLIPLRWEVWQRSAR
ncbi:MAG: ImmA/IrrE family metallo-endopeptidase [Chloroflexia bacterium]